MDLFYSTRAGFHHAAGTGWLGHRDIENLIHFLQAVGYIQRQHGRAVLRQNDGIRFFPEGAFGGGGHRLTVGEKRKHWQEDAVLGSMNHRFDFSGPLREVNRLPNLSTSAARLWKRGDASILSLTTETTELM